jgi:hypothetical protein
MLSNPRWVSEASQSELHLIGCTCLVTSFDHQPNLLHLLSDLLQSAQVATSVFFEILWYSHRGYHHMKIQPNSRYESFFERDIHQHVGLVAEIKSSDFDQSFKFSKLDLQIVFSNFSFWWNKKLTHLRWIHNWVIRCPVDGVLVWCFFTLASIRCTNLLVPQFDQQTCHPPQLGRRGVTDRVAFNLLCLFTLMGKTNDPFAYERHHRSSCI